MASRDENLIETNKRNMPAGYDQYRINIPNELLDHDEELFKQFYEHGFTNDQAQFVYDLANERVIPVLDQLTVSFEAQKQLAKLSSYLAGRNVLTKSPVRYRAGQSRTCVPKSMMLWLPRPKVSSPCIR